MADVYEEIRRLPNPGGKFGRNVAHDVRSRAFRPQTIESPQTVDWEIELPILDQQEGSCVYQTVTELVAFSEHWRTLTPEQKKEILADPQAFIRAWYRWGTRNDPFDGEWEPTDTGSDGNTGGKCTVAHGYANGWVHGFGLEEGFTLLNHGPIGIGGVWMSSFDRPDREGIIRWSADAFERGGHEWAAIGHDTSRGLVKARQTWGTGFGKNGIFYVPDVVLDRILRADGDIIQLVPLDQATPEPTVDPEDLVMAKGVAPWVNSRFFSRITKAGKAAQELKDWARTKGIDL